MNLNPGLSKYLLQQQQSQVTPEKFATAFLVVSWDASDL